MPFNYPIEKQDGDKLCWAAVAKSVDHYFAPESVKSQCSIAGDVLQTTCCPDVETLCNQIEYLEKALDKVKHLESWPTAGFLEFGKIKELINNRMPICVRIEWHGGGGGHFVVICGYRERKGREFVEISDSWFPSSIVSYQEFVDGYQNAERTDGGGFWSHTYPIKK
jgi:Papain-like cysteine protease AvrRpt2